MITLVYFSASGLQTLTFGQNETHIVLYAHHPLYEIDLDLIVTPTSCIGVVDPVYMCSFNQKLSVQETTHYAGVNFNFFCGDKLETSVIKVTLTQIHSCLRIQSLAEGIRTHSILEIRDNIDATLSYVGFSTLRTETSDILGVYYNYNNLTSKTEMFRTENQKLWLNKLTLLKVTYSRFLRYYRAMYLLEVRPVSLTGYCASITENEHTPHNEEVMEILEISILCWMAYYIEPYIFIYEIRSRPLSNPTVGDLRKQILFLNFKRHFLHRQKEIFSEVLTLRMGGLFKQSLYLNVSTFTVQTHDLAVTIIFGKSFKNPDSVMKLHYQAVELSLLTRIPLTKSGTGVIKVNG